MKLISLAQISPKKGFQLSLDQETDWLMAIFSNILGQTKIDLKSIQGKVNLNKTNDIVHITGNLSFSFYPPCSRCGKEILWKENVVFDSHQSPYQAPSEEETNQDKKHKEVQLVKEDLDHSYFYYNDKIRIDTLVNDEIGLKIPFDFYCPESCQTATPSNEHITLNEEIDPRWAPLKDLKKLKH